MALLPATLSTGLQGMTPTLSEVTAINNFANAWSTYFSTALAGAVPVTPGSLTGAIAAMKLSLAGMSAGSAGPAKIQAGIISFWGVVAASSATIWVGSVSAIPPPGLSGIAAAVTAAFSANIAGNLSLSAACSAIATAIHATQTGGTATFVGPVVLAIT